MLLALDIGNTNIVVGVFAGEQLLHSWRLSTQRQRTADEMGMWALQLFQHGRLDPAAVDGVVLASVVPTLTRPTAEMARRYFGGEPLVVDAPTNTGMPVLYDTPSEVGADRIVNGVAAYERYGRADGTAADRRGLRHGDDVRRDLGPGRVPGRRHLPGREHLGRRAVPARRAAAAGGRAASRGGDRPDDGRLDAVGAVLRLHRPGRGDRRADAARTGRARRRAWRPAGLPR